MRAKIVVETAEEHFRVFHTNFELTASEGHTLVRNHLPEGDEPISALASEIVQLPGVERVVLRPYGIGVHKAVAFEWDGIDANVQATLRWVGENFGPFPSTTPQPSAPTGVAK